MKTLRALSIAWSVAVAALAPAAAAEEVVSLFKAADPSGEIIGGTLWIYPTGPGDRLQAWHETDGKWMVRGNLITMSDISWVRADRALRHYLWAPDMVEDKGQYRLYFAVGPQDPTPSRIGVAICRTPAGPCSDSGKPLLTGGREFEAIDPMVFTDARSHASYLYAGGSNGSTLKVFELSDDGLSLRREVPVAQPLNFTEAPFMHERNGIYYLSYSSGRWDAGSYSVHYATSSSPVGPWTYRGAILQSDRRYKGPGHHSFVTKPDGSTWIVYHRWEGSHGDGPYTGQRHVVLQPVSYTADGSIVPLAAGNR